MVWVGQRGYYERIYLWDGSAIVQLSDEIAKNDSPQINDAGQAVWRGWEHPESTDSFIYRWEGGAIQRLRRDTRSVSNLQLNNRGEVLWSDSSSGVEQLYLWDSAGLRPITFGGLQYTPMLSHAGHVVWHGLGPNLWQVYLWQNGVARQISRHSPSVSESWFHPQVNSLGQAAWRAFDRQGAVYFWDGASPQILSSMVGLQYHEGPRLSERGWVVWTTDAGAILLWDGGTVRQISPPGARCLDPQINAAGQVVWQSGGDLFLWEKGQVRPITQRGSAGPSEFPLHQLNAAGQVAWVAHDGGDTEIFQYTPTRPGSLELAHGSIVEGSSTVGTVHLSAPAPEGGAVVTLASSRPAAARMPAAVTVPAGATSASFPVQTALVDGTTVVDLTASHGGEDWQTTLQVTRTSLHSLVLAYAGINSRAIRIQVQLYLDDPAPEGGAEVELAADKPGLGRLPTTVRIPAGKDRIYFQLQFDPVTEATPVDLIATYRGSTLRARITLVDGIRIALQVKVNQVNGGEGSKGYLTLQRPDLSAPAVVRLSTDRPDILTIPESVTVPAGKTLAEFDIQTRPVSTTTGATITAASGTQRISVPFTVIRDGLKAVTFDANPVTGGNETTGRVILGDPAPSHGFTVWLVSFDRNLFRSLPRQVVVPAGATSVSFRVETMPVSEPREGTVVASAGRDKVSGPLLVVPNRLVSLTLSVPRVLGGAPAAATVTLESPAPPGGATIRLASDDAAAVIPPSAVIPAGTTRATVPITTRTVAAPTPVFLTAAYGGTTRDATLTLLPSAPLSLTVEPARISGGLAATATVILRDPAPAGGAIIRLRSAVPAVAPVPERLVLRAGAVTARFSIPTGRVLHETDSLITAEYAGSRSEAPLKLLPIPSDAIDSVLAVSVAANDIAYDPTSGRIYASTASRAGRTGNSLVWIDPYSAAVGPAVAVGPEPGLLALSDSTRSLHVALDGAESVRQFDLQTETLGPELPLGPNPNGYRSYVVDIEAVPGVRDAVAVVRVDSREYWSHPEVMIVDSRGPRGNPDYAVSWSSAIAFSRTADRLYGMRYDGRNSDLYRMRVDASGVTVRELTPKQIPGASSGMVYEGGRIYTPSGYVVDPEERLIVGQVPGLPAPPAPAGWLDPPALVAVDSAVGRIFFLTGDSSGYTLHAFDQRTLQPLGTIPIEGIEGRPTRLIRWGQEPASHVSRVPARRADDTRGGLAVRTSAGQVLLIRTSLVPRVDLQVTVEPAAVVGSQPVQAQVRLSEPAPPAGRLLQLGSSDPRVAAVPPSLVVPAGETLATFPVITSPVETETTVKIRVSHNGSAAEAGLQVLAPPLVGLSIEPSSYSGRGPLTGTVRLGGPAPAAGAVVALASSSITFLAVPESVTVAAGATTATFAIQVRRPELRLSYTVTASRLGTVQKSTVSVRGFVPQSLVFIPGWIRGGGTATGVLTLEEPAPAGGAQVRLFVPFTSRAVPGAQIPDSVTVAAGERSAIFPITIPALDHDNAVTVCAGWTDRGPCATLLALAPMPVSVRFTPDVVFGGDTSVATLTLPEPAPEGGATFFLNTGYMSVLIVPRQVTIPAGSRTVSLTVGTKPVDSPTIETLWPTGPANAEHGPLRVLPREGLQPPGSLSAHPLGPTRVRLDWTDTSAGETGFGVWRRQSGEWTRIGVAPENTPTFVDATAQAGSTYTYRVRAHHDYGASAWSAEVTIRTPR